MDDREPIIDVPYDALSPEALRRLIEEFVTRDTTDYGAFEKTLEEKLRDVMRQLERGEVRIVFDSDQQTTNIVKVA